MAIYLKRRRTTIEEWGRSTLSRTDTESTGMSIWPHSDEGPGSIEGSTLANLAKVAAEVEAYSELDSDGRKVHLSVSKTKQMTGEQK